MNCNNNFIVYMPNIHIGDCCQGKRPNAGGFKWRYKDEYENEQEKPNA